MISCEECGGVVSTSVPAIVATRADGIVRCHACLVKNVKPISDEEMEKRSYAFTCMVCDESIDHGFMMVEGHRGHDWSHPGYRDKPLEISEESFAKQSTERFKVSFAFWCKEVHSLE